MIRLRDEPPNHGFYLREGLGDPDPEPAREWTALLLLGEGGLVSGKVSTEGVDTLRVTGGCQALDPTPSDPLDVADAYARGGAAVDAVVTTVELGLGARLKALADKHGVPTTKPDGTPIKLSRINNDLAKTGASLESDRAQVEAWLELRNDVAHPDGAQTVTAARASALVAGVRAFLDEHPC